jgi:succinoglycan biosynthesis protein ExoO
MTQPLVSVIVPAYNVADYVADCIESVLEQTYPTFELILVDDASTDATCHVIQRYRDPRIRLLRQSRNQGQSAARNRAIRESCGDWLAFLDADDRWAPQRLERLLAVAENEGADMVADDLYRVQVDTSSPIERAFTSRGLRFSLPMHVTPVDFVRWDLGITKPMVRKSFWDTHGIYFDETRRSGGEDFLALLRCLLAGAKFVVIPEAYYFYRLRPGSATSQPLRLFRATRQATMELCQDPDVRQNPALLAQLERRLRRVDQIIAYNELKSALHSRSIEAVMKIVLRHPYVIPFGFQRLFQRLPKAHG